VASVGCFYHYEYVNFLFEGVKMKYIWCNMGDRFAVLNELVHRG